MDQIAQRLAAGDPLGEVAEELSDLKSKLPNGEIGWMTEADLGGAAGVQEITALKAGEQTGLVDTPQGKVVYAMLDRRESAVVSFEQCRPALEASLARQFAGDIKHRRVDELAEELDASMNIDAFIAALRAVPVPQGWEQTWGRNPEP